MTIHPQTVNIQLQVLGESLRAVAEEMGAVLIRSAFSANVKERRDCSTALFDERGRMIAQAEHIPVHLGAMPDAVAAVAAHDPAPGEVWILNDPYAGGTHLPDVTMVSRTALGFAVSRAHHADVGAVEPGSMPADSRTLDEEGVVIPPTRLDDDTLAALVARMRNPEERRGDFRAQLAAHRLAELRVDELCATARARDRGRCDGRAVRVLRASRSRGARRSPRRSLRGGGRARRHPRRARHPSRRDDRRRRDRDRLRRNRAAARREPQLPARGRALGLVLRRPLRDRPRPACVRRSVRARDREGARGLPRQRAPARGRRGGKRRDLEPDRGRPLRRARAGGRRSRAGSGDGEQRHARQRALHVLRDDRRRPGRVPRRRRALGRPRRDVEHALHAGRGARAAVPAARRALRAPARLRRRRASSAEATASSASCACSSRAGCR